MTIYRLPFIELSGTVLVLKVISTGWYVHDNTPSREVLLFHCVLHCASGCSRLELTLHAVEASGEHKERRSPALLHSVPSAAGGCLHRSLGRQA